MNDPLLSLAPFELRALAAQVRAGRLAAPYSALNLQRILGEARAVDVAGRLGPLAASGMSADGLANCLELTADALVSRPQIENLVDLVTSGPEAGGVANRSTEVVVSELFRNARTSVLIAGYAVYQGQRVFQALAERMSELPALQVRMFLDVPRKQGDTSSADSRFRGSRNALDHRRGARHRQGRTIGLSGANRLAAIPLFAYPQRGESV